MIGAGSFIVRRAASDFGGPKIRPLVLGQAVGRRVDLLQRALDRERPMEWIHVATAERPLFARSKAAVAIPRSRGRWRRRPGAVFRQLQTRFVSFVAISDICHDLTSGKASLPRRRRPRLTRFRL
jgi:hypothetical protein